jgi:hypothetical protein
LAPPSLPRVPTGRVPRVQRYYGVLRRPASLSPHFVAFVWRYHGLRLLLRSRRPETQTAGQGFESRSPLPANRPWRRSGPPRFLGNPLVHTPCSPTPAGPTHQALRRYRRGPRPDNDEGSRNGTLGAQSHGLCTRCLRFAGGVAPAPRKTRFPLLATLRDGIGYPQDSSERFRSCVLHLVLLSQACLAQCQEPFTSRKGS